MPKDVTLLSPPSGSIFAVTSSFNVKSLKHIAGLIQVAITGSRVYTVCDGRLPFQESL